MGLSREELEAEVAWAMQVIEFGDAQQRIQGERVGNLATYALSLMDTYGHGCELLELQEKHASDHLDTIIALKWKAGQLEEQLAAAEERERGLRGLLQRTGDHLEDLRVAWERGALSEHDSKGGTRSNRNHALVREIGSLEQALKGTKDALSQAVEG